MTISKPVLCFSHEETKVYNLLNDYLNANPKIGYLTFDVYQESPVEGRVPIPNAIITISKQLGDGYFIAKVITCDENGKTEPIPMPTVDKNLSYSPEYGYISATYNARVEALGFKTADFYDIHIFEGITTYQRADLTPDENEK